jgi:hypothetical protein
MRAKTGIALFSVTALMLATSCVSALAESGNDAGSIYIGDIDGVRISIPSKYVRSAEIEVQEHPTKTVSVGDIAKLKSEKIYGLGLPLRRSDYQPILDDQDLRDWYSSYLKPSSHRWLTVGVGPIDRLTSMNSRIHKKISEQKQLHCDIKFDLTHCHFEKATDDPFEIEDVFFNASGSTLIACAGSEKQIYLNCSHHFSSRNPSLSIGVTYDLYDQLNNWKDVEHSIDSIVEKFIN